MFLKSRLVLSLEALLVKENIPSLIEDLILSVFIELLLKLRFLLTLNFLLILLIQVQNPLLKIVSGLDPDSAGLALG